MAQIKSTADIANKWQTVTPQRTADFEAGVKAPRRSWAQSAAAAEGNYKAGVQQAMQKGSFGKGVQKAGDQKWQNGAITKGVNRWGAGIAQAGDAFQAGFEPYQKAIASVNLPPRFPKRDARNLDRVKAITDAVGKEKERQLGQA